MSHTTRVQAVSGQGIKDLAALAAAAVRCGGVFVKDKTSARTYGRRPIPCVHAITLKGSPADAYEIGVEEVKGKPGVYGLAFDSYDGKLDPVFSTKPGGKLDKLQMFYELEAAKNFAKTRGYTYSERMVSPTKWVAEMVTSNTPGRSAGIAMTV